jgi:hypothetical protein
MTTSDWILVLTGAGSVLAILSAPVVALWISGKLQRRSDSYKAKLDIFSTLMGLRYAPLSEELARALNLIDAVFTDDLAVREAWTRYHIALLDPNLNVGPGYALREEKRRDLLLEIVKALGLSGKISSAELLRSYTSVSAFEAAQLTALERLYKRTLYEEELKRRGVTIPAWMLPPQEATPVSPIPSPPPGGNAGKPTAPQTNGQPPP